MEDKLASVLLATDGVYDIFFPYLLKGQPVEVYVPLIRYFMDNTGIHVSEYSIGDITEERRNFLNSSVCEAITDDKTLLVLINGSIIPKQKDASYYAEPNWDALQLEWNKKAYPHLYEKKKDKNTKADSSNSKQEIVKKDEKPSKKTSSVFVSIGKFLSGLSKDTDTPNTKQSGASSSQLSKSKGETISGSRSSSSDTQNV